MRFIILVKASKDTEAGAMPGEQLIVDMAAFHGEMAKAGILLDANGLAPSDKGFRIRYSGDKRTVTEGPFAETKELVAGYTVIEVQSREEALTWAKRFPNPAVDRGEAEIEVRQLYEIDDLGESRSLDRFRNLDIARRK